jgi:hypothetical protein
MRQFFCIEARFLHPNILAHATQLQICLIFRLEAELNILPSCLSRRGCCFFYTFETGHPQLFANQAGIQLAGIDPPRWLDSSAATAAQA